jgi:hypothetical protein
MILPPLVFSSLAETEMIRNSGPEIEIIENLRPETDVELEPLNEGLDRNCI